MEINELFGLGSVPVVVALVELVKRTLPELPARFHPTVAVFWGVVLNIALAYLLGLNYGTAAILGVLAGLMAAGLYQYGAARGRTEATFVEYDPDDDDPGPAKQNLGIR